MAGEGISVPALPFGPDPSDQQARTRMVQQALEEISARLQQLGGGSSSGGGFVPETWDGSAVDLGTTPDTAGPVTTDHELAEASTNDAYAIDTVLSLDVVGVDVIRTVTITLQVDPDGGSGYSTVDTFTIAEESRNMDQVWPLVFLVEGQSMEAGGSIRFSVAVNSKANVEVDFTPALVRGF